MPFLRPDDGGTERPYLSLAVRGLVIGVCALVTALAREVGPHGAGSTSPSVTIAPALLLLLIAVLGTLPLPRSVPPLLQPVVEILAAALVVGSLPGRADFFLPYLVVPLVGAGLSTGVAASLLASGVAALVFVLSRIATKGTSVAGAAELPVAEWLPVLVALALLGVWAVRATRSPRAGPDPAYADAHRLLSELHVVARQLSLGLDPQTLAAALVDELQGRVESDRTTVLIRSPGGRFVPLVGDVPSPAAENAVLDAWLSADVVRRQRSGTTVAALPVLMGERVVAVVVLSGPRPVDERTLRECRDAIAQAGPRLASALLFDDVRRLATVDERMRLAREIHDGIAQDLASVGYLLDDIARDAPGEVADRLGGLRQHLGGLVGELRLSIFDLRAGVDETVGLVRTLGDYVTRVGQQSGLRVHVSSEESPHQLRLPVATEIEVLRIVQEAMTNVRKHAEASTVWLTVSVDPPRAKVTITDDGRGLQPRRPESMGITGMKERARRIGAVLAVRDRADGRGTVVEVSVDPDRDPGGQGVSGGVATAELPTLHDSRQLPSVDIGSAERGILPADAGAAGRRAPDGSHTGGDR